MAAFRIDFGMRLLGRLFSTPRASTAVNLRTTDVSECCERSSACTGTASSHSLPSRLTRMSQRYGWAEESYRLAGSTHTAELESKLSAVFEEQSWLPECSTAGVCAGDDVSFRKRLRIDGEWRHQYNKRVMHIQHATSLLNAGFRAGVDFYAISATRATSRDNINQVTKYEGYRCPPTDLIDEDGRVLSGGFCLPSGLLAATVVLEIEQDPENCMWLARIPFSASHDNVIPYMLDDEVGQDTLERAHAATQLRERIRKGRDDARREKSTDGSRSRVSNSVDSDTRCGNSTDSFWAEDQENGMISPSMPRENALALRTIMPTLWADLAVPARRLMNATIRDVAFNADEM